jgi:hypothetical protein
MSLDLTIGTRSAPARASVQPQDDEAAAGSRLWLYELLVAAGAALGAVLASAVSVLLYLR